MPLLSMPNLSALYLSLKRTSEIVDLPVAYGAESIREVPTDQLQRVRVIAAMESRILEWLSKPGVATLGELLMTGELKQGSLFTHLGAIYGRGISDAAVRYSEGKEPKTEPVLWTKLDSFHPGAKITIQAHPQNYTSVSAVGELSKRHRLFLVGRITQPDLPNLEAQAYVVGHLYSEDRPSPVRDAFDRIQWQMEMPVSMIDSFCLPKEFQPASKAEVALLRNIPESDIKTAFAQIIGEPFVPKDWGGERSDLATSRLRIDGKPAVAAFAFKGPAKFKPLTVADLGKNGDQISRLFSEPVDICVLQHCHQITSAVRDHMRAFATRIHQLRPFCLIDGADTVQILHIGSLLSYLPITVGTGARAVCPLGGR